MAAEETEVDVKAKVKEDATTAEEAIEAKEGGEPEEEEKVVVDIASLPKFHISGESWPGA